jgi:hypothetical protein
MRAHETSEFDPLEEAIAARAFEIYLRRGQEPGHEVEDWQQAEEELRQAARSAIASWNPYLGYWDLVIAQIFDDVIECEPASAGEVEFAKILALEPDRNNPGNTREVVTHTEGRGRKRGRR